MANLTELSRVQTTTLALARVVLNAAVACQVVDRPTFRAYLEPRLDAAESAWGELHATLRDLSRHAHRRVSRDLRLTGSELVLALRDVVLEGTAVADPATIASRVDLGHTVSPLADATDAPHQASLFLLDAALDPRSRVNANAAQHLISQLATTTGEPNSPQDSWIDPRDLVARRDTTPPAPVRGIFSRQVEAISATSRALAAGASGLVAVTAPTATHRDERARPVPDRDSSGPVPPQTAVHVSR